MDEDVTSSSLVDLPYGNPHWEGFTGTVRPVRDRKFDTRIGRLKMVSVARKSSPGSQI